MPLQLPNHPRLREVLAGLLEGLSEKQIGQRLDLNWGTIHIYVKRIYRHYRVTSRAELFSLFLQKPEGLDLPPPSPSPVVKDLTKRTRHRHVQHDAALGDSTCDAAL